MPLRFKAQFVFLLIFAFLVALLCVPQLVVAQETDRATPSGREIPGQNTPPQVTPRAGSYDEVINWSELTANDAYVIHETMLNDHSAILDTQNTAFRKAITEGLKAARSAASKVRDAQGYRAVLSRYVNALKDPHTAIGFSAGLGQVKTAGIVAIWRQDRFEVVEAKADSGFLDGDQIIACDSARDLKADVAFAIEGTQSSTWQYWWQRLAGDYFVDKGDPVRRLPQSCTAQRSGQLVSVPLRWRVVDWSEESPKFRQGYADPKTSIELRKVANGYYWLSAPTFAPKSGGIRDFNRMIARLEENELEYRSSRIFVFDFRGNSGGSTVWGDRMIDALWSATILGDVRTAVLKSLPGGFKWWRASIGTLRLIDGFIEEVRGEDQGADWVKYFGNVKGSILRALAQQRPYVADPDNEPLTPISPSVRVSADGSAFEGRVYVLTDAACFSACVLTVDKFRRIPGVIHIGAPTGPHTAYGEVADFALPSGHAVLALPIAWMRSFVLKPGEVLLPQIRYDGPWTTEALERWVAGL